MGLDFTDVSDRHGAALYVLHNANTMELQRLTNLQEELQGLTDHQVKIIDVKTADGEKIRDFYDITPEQLPTAMLVKDDDTIAQQWSGDFIPSARDLSHHLRQISS